MVDGEKVIIERILADAERAAASSVREAETQAAEMLDRTERECAARREELLAAAQGSAADLKRHRLTLADLELRKDALAARQAVVDRAFSEAARSLKNMPVLRYQDMIKGMLRKYAASGDIVVVSKADEQRIPPAFIAACAKDLRMDLSYSGGSEDFDGGIKLVSAACDKNLTFQSLFKMLRQEIEAEVVKKLFQEG